MITINTTCTKPVNIEIGTKYCINGYYLTIEKPNEMYRIFEYTDHNFTVIIEGREFTIDGLNDIITDFGITIDQLIEPNDKQSIKYNTTLLMENVNDIFGNEFATSIAKLVAIKNFDISDADQFQECYNIIMEYIGEDLSYLLKHGKSNSKN